MSSLQVAGVFKRGPERGGRGREVSTVPQSWEEEPETDAPKKKTEKHRLHKLSTDVYHVYACSNGTTTHTL